MPLDRKLCVVVADGGHARFLHEAADHGLHTFEAMDSATVHKHTHELVSDRAGRAFESASPARHAFTARLDPHEQEKIRFVRVVSQLIKEHSEAGVFKELVLVAPAQVLNELTEALDSPTRAKLVGSLAKDLTKVPEHDLSPHLKQWVRPVHRA